MPRMWSSDLTLAMTLTMNFQGQIWNLLYLSQRWFDCRKMKSTHIEWTEGLNDNQVWPWPWPWKVRCKVLPDSDRGDFRCRPIIDSSSFVWGNGLALNRCQAITWSNVDPDSWCHMTSLGHSELISTIFIPLCGQCIPWCCEQTIVSQMLNELMTEISWKLFALMLIAMIRSSNNFTHVTTAGLSWHVQNCDLICSLFFT